ncbi:MAG: protease modulator HflC [Treponema sp.]|jgi:membrane protease subunit HflC|nr:protease modulator HflC [Treponema sp.]
MNKVFKLLFALIFVVIVIAAGFTFTVKEGFCTVISRFGKIVNVHTQAGLHFRLPLPIDKLITYDTRNQYMDSGYNETLTNDKINIILQTYIVWRVADAKTFYTSTGNFEIAQRHLNDLAASAKNGVLGNYTLSSLVSTNLDDIKLVEICEAIEEKAAQSAMENYGIEIQTLKIKRIALPDANIQSVFGQMIADRQKYVSQFVAEGERDSAIIVSEASARAAEIIALGRLEASEIDAETERRIAEIYGEAYNTNSTLFIFLKKLIALENSVSADTILIMRASESPFDVITGIN